MTPNKIYIATTLTNAKAANQMRDALIADAWELTYDWTVHGSVQNDGADRIREVAINEAVGVMSADAVVAILPGGRGTHAEIGIAIGAKIPVVLFAAKEAMLQNGVTCAFYSHPLVTWVDINRGVDGVRFELAWLKHLQTIRDSGT